jgi:hypothetical protein
VIGTRPSGSAFDRYGRDRARRPSASSSGRCSIEAHQVARREWRSDMLWALIVILFILWLLGFSLHVAGGLIHLLLVLAVIVLLYQFLTGRRTV